jgi:hypothetical protein
VPDRIDITESSPARFAIVDPDADGVPFAEARDIVEPQARGSMPKHSQFERARRDAETERMREIERAWNGSIAPSVASTFEAQVRAAKERGPLPPPPNMAPGTAPRPPRPGHEPKPPKNDNDRRRR